MALTHLSLILSLVLVSLAIGASASGTEYYEEDSKYDQVQKPNYEEPKAENGYEEVPVTNHEEGIEKIPELPKKEDVEKPTHEKPNVAIEAHVNLPKLTTTTDHDDKPKEVDYDQVTKPEPKAESEEKVKNLPYNHYGEEDPLASSENHGAYENYPVAEEPKAYSAENQKDVPYKYHDHEEEIEKTHEFAEKEEESSPVMVPKPSLEKPEEEVTKTIPEKPALEKPEDIDESHLNVPKNALEILAEKEVPKTESAAIPEPKVNTEKPKPEEENVSKKYEHEKPEVEEEKQYSCIAVQGIVYCQSSSGFTPLRGAVARITCLNVDKEGYELAPVSKLSKPTDEKGYFYASIAKEQGISEISNCKVFLNNSPSETCNVPTDMNNGVGGAVPGSYHLLANKKTKLYSVGPFFYTTQQKSVEGPY